MSKSSSPSASTFVRSPWSYYVSWYAFQSQRPRPNVLFRIMSEDGTLDFKASVRNLLELGNDVHLYAEEFLPGVGQLGNFPQAFTHVAIIGAAQQLADARSHEAWQRTTAGQRAAIRRGRGTAGPPAGGSRGGALT